MPTYGPHRIESQKKVIERYIESVEAESMDAVLHICDNNSPQEFKDYLKGLLEKYKDHEKVKLIVFFFKENIGKARAVNQAYKQSRKCDLFCSMVSDMYIKNIGTFWGSFVEGVGVKLWNGLQAGAISTNQVTGSVHNEHTLKKAFTINNHPFKSSGSRHGVAGSMLIMSSGLWEKVGGYMEYDNIFGGNDGTLFYMIEGHKQIPIIAMDAQVDHIGENPKDYHQWKVQQATTLKKGGGFKTGSGFYDKGDE